MLIMKRDQITVARKMQQSENQMCRFRASCLQTLRPLAKNRNLQRLRRGTQAYRYDLIVLRH
jgi:hypothetical protein